MSQSPPVLGLALIIEVPDEIVAVATDEFFPLSQGVVQFDEGRGLAELRMAWLSLTKRVEVL